MTLLWDTCAFTSLMFPLLSFWFFLLLSLQYPFYGLPPSLSIPSEKSIKHHNIYVAMLDKAGLIDPVNSIQVGLCILS